MKEIKINADTVLQINGESSAHVVEGTGQEMISKVLKEYPLYKRKVNNVTTNIVVLKGFVIEGEFVPFIPTPSKKIFVKNR